jgi:hypothetical protein
LQGLDADDLAHLQPHLTKFSMVLGGVLHAPRPPRSTTSIFLSASLLTVMRTGEQIETAIVGREGVVGA